jgi:hypothetical protein
MAPDFALIFGAKYSGNYPLQNSCKMKRIKFLTLSVALFFVAVAQAQTVDEIINKHVDAVGGKEKLGQLKSLYVETSIEVMGNSAPSFENLLEGKAFKSESEFNGMKIVNCFTDKGGWFINAFAGAAEAQAMPDEMYKAGKDNLHFGGSLYFAAPLTDYAAKGDKAELLGKEGTNYRIKLTNTGKETTYYIDETTHYLTKTVAKGEMMGQSVEIVSTYSDHKKTDFGLVIPYTRSTDFGGFTLGAKVTKVELNKEIDPKIFEMGK